MKIHASSIRYQIILFSVLFFLFSVLVGCDKINFFKAPPKPAKDKPITVKGTVIAKVNNVSITLEELNRYIDIFNASMDLRQDLTPEQKKLAKIDTREKKIDYLKNVLVRQAVFYQEALDRGLDQKEDIMQVLQRDKIAILAQEAQSEVVRNLDVSSAEVQEAYDSNKNLFREPEVRRIREIVTRTEDEARQILIELLQGADFASIAKNRSIAGSAKDGGDLGSLKKGQRGGEQSATFDEIAFSPALRQGAVSSVFKGPEGYCIVKIENIKEGRQVPVSEAWDTIKRLLLLRKQKDELDKAYSKLSSEAKIEIYEGEIK